MANKPPVRYSERSCQRQHSNGFTLIELMVVIAIAGILVSLATPSFVNLTKNSRMRSEANAMLGAFAYARTEAIRRGNLVHIGAQDNGVGLSSGLVVWIDGATGNLNAWNAGEELRIWEPLNSSMNLSSAGGNTYFTFNASGIANTSDTLTLCDDRTGETGRTIRLLVSGITYLSDVTCP